MITQCRLICERMSIKPEFDLNVVLITNFDPNCFANGVCGFRKSCEGTFTLILKKDRVCVFIALGKCAFITVLAEY